MARTKVIPQNGSTLFLRSVIYLLGLAVLAICIFFLPPVIWSELQGDFDYAPLLLGLYVAAVPFFAALYQSLQILSAIDLNEAFSMRTVVAFKKIKYAAFLITILFGFGMPYIFWLADRDDAPGLFALNLIIVFVAANFAVFAAVMQRLFANAVAIKSENDLTV